MHATLKTTTAAALMALAACSTPPGNGPTGQGLFSNVQKTTQGACWSKITTPATIRSEIRQVPLTPDTGAGPPVFRTETTPKIVKPRQEAWFETPCPPTYTPEFIASLQRALRARGHYAGPVNSALDAETKTAIRAYQRSRGLDSPVLSSVLAREIGLLVVERDG